MPRDYDFPMFTPTKWDTVETKEKFARQFIRFVECGFKFTLFSKGFYQRLSMTFGFIAHYNQYAFYHEYFDDADGKARFYNAVLQHGCYGQSDYTYSDVERYLKGWLQEYLSRQ